MALNNQVGGVASTCALAKLPDELLLHVLRHLDIPELLAMSRISHRFRRIALDPLLHLQRLRAYSLTLSSLISNRPAIRSLQPPTSSIYLTRTHVAAQRLRFGLLSASLNRSLSRRPPLSSLVKANIVPLECCRRDRASGEVVIATGGLLERKRKVEKEKFKEGLRVWLERKANEIKRRRRDNIGVGILIWRFSKRARIAAGDGSNQSRTASHAWDRPEDGRVQGLKGFWEGLATGAGSLRIRC